MSDQSLQRAQRGFAKFGRLITGRKAKTTRRPKRRTRTKARTSDDYRTFLKERLKK